MVSTTPLSHNPWHPELYDLLDKLILLVTQARGFDLTLPTHEPTGRIAVQTLGALARQALEQAQQLAALVEQLPIHADAAPRFTPRERQVLVIVAEGSTNKAIAHHLGLSERTVQFHVRSLFGKTGTASRTELVALAIWQGWISSSERHVR